MNIGNVVETVVKTVELSPDAEELQGYLGGLAYDTNQEFVVCPGSGLIPESATTCASYERCPGCDRFRSRTRAGRFRKHNL